MPVLNDAPLSAALDLYQKSDVGVRALKSKLTESDVQGIVREVLTGVKKHALRNERSVDAPSRAKVENLAYALISDDREEGQRFIEQVYEDGASLEAIYLNYLAEAASVLGEWWESDHASFYEVSIGTSRIYAIVRGLSYLFVPKGLVEFKSAVFASVPDEAHTLGVRMASDLFGQAGWDIETIVGQSHDALVAQISRSTSPIIGLSAGGGHSLATLARLVIALRISNPWAAIVLSGPIARDADAVVSALDVDGVVADVPSALKLFDRLWMQSAKSKAAFAD